MFEGARNLVTKAVDALERGDAAKADRLMARAAALPWDDHENAFPGVLAGQLLLYTEVDDAWEDCLVGDETWLDAALTVLDRVSGTGREALAATIRSIAVENVDDLLTSHEQHRIHAAVGRVPLEPLHIHEPDLPVASRVAMLRSIVMATLDVHLEYFHRETSTART